MFDELHRSKHRLTCPRVTGPPPPHPRTRERHAKRLRGSARGLRVRRETGAFRPAPRGGGASAHAPAQRAIPRACGMGHLNSTASSLLPVMRSERLARARKRPLSLSTSPTSSLCPACGPAASCQTATPGGVRARAPAGGTTACSAGRARPRARPPRSRARTRPHLASALGAVPEHHVLVFAGVEVEHHADPPVGAAGAPALAHYCSLPTGRRSGLCYAVCAHTHWVGICAYDTDRRSTEYIQHIQQRERERERERRTRTGTRSPHGCPSILNLWEFVDPAHELQFAQWRHH